MVFLVLTIFSIIIFFVLMLYCFYGFSSLPSPDTLAKKWLEHLEHREIREAEEEAERKKKEWDNYEAKQKRREDAFNRLNQLEIEELESHRIRKIRDRQKIVAMQRSAMDIWDRDLLRAQGLLKEEETYVVTPTGYAPTTYYGTIDNRGTQLRYAIDGQRQAYGYVGVNGYAGVASILEGDHGPIRRSDAEVRSRELGTMQGKTHWDMYHMGIISKDEFLDRERTRMNVPASAKMDYRDGVLTVDHNDGRLGDVTIHDHISLSKKHNRDLQKKIKLAEERWKDEDDVPWRGFKHEWEVAVQRSLEDRISTLVADRNRVLDSLAPSVRYLTDEERTKLNKYRNDTDVIIKRYQEGSINFETATRYLANIAMNNQYR